MRSLLAANVGLDAAIRVRDIVKPAPVASLRNSGFVVRRYASLHEKPTCCAVVIHWSRVAEPLRTKTIYGSMPMHGAKSDSCNVYASAWPIVVAAWLVFSAARSASRRPSGFPRDVRPRAVCKPTRFFVEFFRSYSVCCARRLAAS